MKLAVAGEGGNPAGPLSEACNTTDGGRVDAQPAISAIINIVRRYAKVLTVNANWANVRL